MLRPHIHLVVPTLCKLMSDLQAMSVDTTLWQLQTVQTLLFICSDSQGAVTEHCHAFLAIVVHTMVRTLSSHANPSTIAPTYPSTNYALPGTLSAAAASATMVANQRQQELNNECVALLVSLAQQLGSRILPFDSLILRTLSDHGLNAPFYREISTLIRSGQWDENQFNEHQDSGWQQNEQSFQSLQQQQQQLLADLSLPGTAFTEIDWGKPFHLSLNQQQLARSWDASQRSTASDWNEWIWRFNVELLRESPIPALRVCAPLAQNHPPMARELFHAAFVSCWHELTEPYQESLIRNLQRAFHSNSTPPDILQVLLNLAEFMEHDVEALPISLTVLAELAQKGHAYAKALHYREREFQTNPVDTFISCAR